jgi:hypothetical protein
MGFEVGCHEFNVDLDIFELKVEMSLRGRDELKLS